MYFSSIIVHIVLNLCKFNRKKSLGLRIHEQAAEDHLVHDLARSWWKNKRQKWEQLCGYYDTEDRRVHRLQLGVQVPLPRTLVHVKVIQHELADKARILSQWTVLQEHLGEDLPESN